MNTELVQYNDTYNDTLSDISLSANYNFMVIGKKGVYSYGLQDNSYLGFDYDGEFHRFTNITEIDIRKVNSLYMRDWTTLIFMQENG